MLLAALLYLGSISSLATAGASLLSPRKSTAEDPYIVCNNIPPLTSIPVGYLLSWYPTTLALCSALNGAARNVGCTCHSSTSSLHCDEAIADPNLFYARTAGYSQYLWEFCYDACWCSSAASARAGRLRSNSRFASTTTMATTASPDATDEAAATAAGVINVPLRPRPHYRFSGTRRPIQIQANATFEAQVGAVGGGGRNWWQNQCGSNCSSNADCTAGGSGGESGCTCLAAQKSTFDPKVGTVAFVAACVVSLASNAGGGLGGQVGAGSVAAGGGGAGGGKRSVGEDNDAMACPCNTTYVSSKCCDVSDGLVWEGIEFKLGELAR